MTITEDEYGRPLFPLTISNGWILGSFHLVAHGGTDQGWQDWRSHAFRKAHPDLVAEIERELKERMERIRRAKQQEAVALAQLERQR